jgi:cytochrome c
MFKIEQFKSTTALIVGLIITSLIIIVIYLSLSAKNAEAKIVLLPGNLSVTKLGKTVYMENCASCHGALLEGQANWQQRDSDGYMPAPPHDVSGHTWHHPSSYLFLMTKYGIEKMIGEKYPNNMPAYENKLTDNEIIAVLSYIKSTWPKPIQRQHDEISAYTNKK